MAQVRCRQVEGRQGVHSLCPSTRKLCLDDAVSELEDVAGAGLVGEGLLDVLARILLDAGLLGDRLHHLLVQKRWPDGGLSCPPATPVGTL